MAEDATNAQGADQGQNVPTNDNGAIQQPAGEEKSTFNIKDLPEEAWAEIYKSGRFKTLNERAKVADKLEEEKRLAEEALAKEQGKWKEIAEKKEAEVKQWADRTLTSEIKAFAAKFNAHDINDVAALVDKSGVKLDESGNVIGAEDAVKALFEAKPHLFNTNQTPTKVGSGTNPGDASNQGIPKFTLSEIQSMSPEDYQKNKANIMKALAANAVVDDTKR